MATPNFNSATINAQTLTLAYSINLNTDNPPVLSNFGVNVNGNPATLQSVAVSGKDVTLTLQTAVTNTDTVTVSYTDPTSDNDANAIQEKNNPYLDAASITNASVTNNTPDTTAPVFQSATVNASTLILAYNETLDSSTGAKPAISNFSVKVDGVAVTPTAVSISGSNVSLTLPTAVTSTNIVTVSYTDPTANNDNKAVQDLAGNDALTIADKPVTNTTPDTTPPDAPTGLDLATGSDTGSSTTDDLTKTNNGLVITGSAEAGSTVNLYDGSTLIGSATATGGTFSITTNVALTDGVHTLTAKATDTAGNEGAASTALSVTVDTTAPAAPTGLDLAAADDSGSSDTDNITKNTSAQTVSGSAVAGSIVKLYEGATVLGTTTADGDGNFSFELALPEGGHSLTATATDAAGNESVASSPVFAMTVDTTAPDAPTGLDLATGSDTGSSTTDDLTKTNNGLVITGSAEAGSTVNLYDGSTLIGSATATGGTFSITTSVPLGDGVHALTVKATDAAGNESSASTALSVTVDTTAPAAPTGLDLATGSDTGSSTTDDLTKTNNGLVITGSAEAGSTVNLYDGSTLIGSATATGGTFSITTNVALTDGVHTLTAKATDAAGNEGAASTALSVTVDTTAPAAPTGLDLAAADDSGSSDSDNITKNTSAQTVSGSAVAGSIVKLYNGTTLLDTTTADGSGNFSFELALPEGGHSLTATATDAAGNESAASSPVFAMTVDTTAPDAPTGLDLAAADDSGSSDADNLTKNTSAQTVSGSAVAGSIVKLYEGATVLGTTTAATDGSFSFELALPEGSHSLTATATDAAGNESAASTALSVTVDTTAPAAPSGLDLAAADDSGSSNTDNLTRNTNALTISGTAEANSSVTLYEGATIKGTGTANASGTFSIDVSLTEGVHNLTAKATDAAGNTSPASTGLSMTIDTTAPSIQSATVTAQYLTLTYSEALNVSQLPNASAFSVNINNAITNVTVTPTSVSLNGNSVVLTLPVPASHADTVILNYTDPTAGDDTNATQDTVGNDAASLASHRVTNNMPRPPDTYTPPENDADGISDSEEAYAPSATGSGRGDGNSDGIQDNDQDYVTSFRSGNNSNEYMTLVNAGKLDQSILIVQPEPQNLPPGLDLPLGLVMFTVKQVNTPSMDFSVYVDADIPVTGYYKQVNGVWINIATHIETVGNKTRIDFSIDDGGPYDRDGVVNGQITDPGGVGYRAGDVIPPQPDDGNSQPDNPPVDTDGDTDNDQFPDLLEALWGLQAGVKDNDVFSRNDLFVLQTYRDIMGREGETGGVDYWKQQLDSGATSRAQLVSQFMDSPEFQQGPAATTRLYLGVLERIPDQAGLEYWLGSELELQQIAESFANSQEFQQRYGQLNNADYIDQVYLNVLDRHADATGKAFWVEQMTYGMTRGEVIVNFTESQEYQHNTHYEVNIAIDYVGLLDRSPDQTSYDHWLALYESNSMDEYDVIQGFLNTQEYHDRFLL